MYLVELALCGVFCKNRLTLLEDERFEILLLFGDQLHLAHCIDVQISNNLNKMVVFGRTKNVLADIFYGIGTSLTFCFLRRHRSHAIGISPLLFARADCMICAAARGNGEEVGGVLDMVSGECSFGGE